MTEKKDRRSRPRRMCRPTWGRSRPPYIVAEVSCTWPASRPEDNTAVSSRFEAVIAFNLERGYVLQSWRLAVTHTPVKFEASKSDAPGWLVETIVAVFACTTADAGEIEALRAMLEEESPNVPSAEELTRALEREGLHLVRCVPIDAPGFPEGEA